MAKIEFENKYWKKIMQFNCRPCNVRV